MSFTIRSSFSTNYLSVGSVRVPSYSPGPVSSAASVYAGAGGSGSRISVTRSASFLSGMGVRGLAAGMARGLAGMGGIQNEKEIMQILNDGLASDLDSQEPGDLELEAGEQNPGAPGEEGTPGQGLGPLLQDHRGPEGSDLLKYCGQCPHRSAD
ncbi:Keratin, type I cytoskeletal 18 [Saguinus oedipus]|uniref:Keratin, type I cytoskeletal 18 n=1 Tax=Saguinus oedipus TaxID=9490 RepID=A0ABQ9W3W7_SAGOE|nr:Keratin, type I cytoskeletal 18 [Saguinus oedipus]